ncbi:putative FERM domain-containing protein FRMD8P1 isoform X2 [Macrosteles quadrilineatus]|uniref:putative FERM domain-containing protein FRMD8P1 isoform X2 n=1 Tax=Macrosteles quadrilineatus TaxID=74068 RepID=UPI0023E1EC75|nr:putative FERM domain-containing protein FRMD8P1 isoform X2 [Macrosteles quadrilineatus]
MALTSSDQQRDSTDPESGHNYITVIPVEFQRSRGYPQPPDQYSDYKSIDGEFNRPDIVKSGSGVENSKTISPEAYKQSLDNCGKFGKEHEDNAINAQWEKEKNQEAQNDSSIQPLKVCVYLMSDVALHMELEDGVNTTVKELTQAIVTEEQLGLPRSAANIFTLWMCSGLLELRLKPHHQPFAVRAKWPDLLVKYAHATESRQRRDEPVLSFQRNVFVSRSVDERVKDPKIMDLLYCEARYNILEGRYPCEVGHYIMLGGIQARLELGPYNPHIHTIHFFREQYSRFLPPQMRRGAWRSWLGLGGKNCPEIKLLEHYKRIPPSTPDRKLQRKYLEFCWALPYYGCAFFQGQVEQPVRGLTSLITHQDIPVLVGINPQGIYVIDNTQCILLLGLKFEEMSWDFAKPSQEDNPDCLPCIFIQFRVVENGMRVSKILQIFSKQAVMMDALISGFVEDIKKKTSVTTKQPATDETDRPPVYDTATDSDGRCIGQMGSWSFSY